MKKRYLSFLLCASLMHYSGLAQEFTNFQEASLVIGQPSFTSSSGIASQTIAGGGNSSALSANGVFVIGSQTYGRVLIWNAVPQTSGQPADVVVGKSSFVDTAPGISASLMRNCDGVAFSPDGRKLIASDGSNNRVLIWNSIPTTNGQPADVVIGQTNFSSSSSGLGPAKFSYPVGLMVTPDGKLFVNDLNNHRVLVFNQIPTSNGASADLVIGQPGFFSGGFGAGPNQLGRPWYCALSPDGKLLISEEINNRVLIFNAVPTANGASADVVIGQQSFGQSSGGISAFKFFAPIGVAVSKDGKVAVGEFANHRVLIFDKVPTSNGAPATIVLGQPNFTSAGVYNGGVSSRSMRSVYGVHFDSQDRLFVNGRDMHRVMVFQGASTNPTITIEEPLESSYCTGATIDVKFIATGRFESGNLFVAQLSDANGGFEHPTIIGSVNSSIAGVIPCTLPENIAPGFTYRIRVVSTSPQVVGSDNGVDIAISQPRLFYGDADGDGFAGGDGVLSCVQPPGYSEVSVDCDDSKVSVNPSAPEICDGLDNDCDGLTDEDVLTTYYADADGDGFGNETSRAMVCSQPQGFVLQSGDCNDSDPTIHPGATELCDGIDHNCDGFVLSPEQFTIQASQPEVCPEASVTLSAVFTNVSEVSVGPIAGQTSPLNGLNATGSNVTCDCPPGFVAVGYEGRTGSWMDNFRLLCKQVLPNGTLGNQIVASQTAGGMGGGPAGPHVLSGDHALVHIQAGSTPNFIQYARGSGHSISAILGQASNQSAAQSLPPLGPVGGQHFAPVFAPPGHAIIGFTANVNGGGGTNVYVAGISFRFARISRTQSAAAVNWSNGEVASSITVKPAETATYSAILNGQNGCTSSADIEITVFQRPTASITGTASICPGGSTNLTINSTGFGLRTVTYRENDEEKTLTTSDNVHSFSVAPNASTIYTLVSITDEHCSADVTGSAEVTIHSPPVLTIPTITPVYNETGTCEAPVLFEASAAGSPSPAITYKVGETPISSPHRFAVGKTLVTVMATNECATVTGTFEVQVTDNEAPTFTRPARDGDVVYLRSSVSAPWGMSGNELAMNVVFGLGSWKDLRFETANVQTLFSSDTKFIFMEGGDATANELRTFIQTNLAAIEQWVFEGGSILINAAPNEGGNINFGFGGVTLIYPDFTETGAATDPDHYIFNGAFTPVGTSWQGTYLGHAIISPSGLDIKPLIHNEANGRNLLVELKWGSGIAMFGGLTLPFFQSNFGGVHWEQPMTGNLHKNILSYLGNENRQSECTDITAIAPADVCGAIVNYIAPAGIDNCPGAATIQLSGLASGSLFPVGETINVFEISDAAGNKATCSFTVTVKDETKPTVKTKEISVDLNAMGNVSILPEDVNDDSFDVCGIKSLALDKSNFDCSHVGRNRVILTVTDNHDNVESLETIVIVNDVTSPTAVTKNITLQLDANGSASMTPAEVDGGSDDICGIKSLVLSKTTFDCSNVGVNTVTLSVTDVNGNVNSAAAIVTVEDKIKPLALGKNITVQLDETGNVSILPQDVNDGSSDKCGIQSFALSKSDFTCANVGTNTVTLTVTDNNGNASTVDVEVKVEDHVLPDPQCQSIEVYLSQEGDVSISPAQIDNGSSDACGIASMDLSIDYFNTADVGANNVTLTVTDNNGNVSSCDADVVVLKRPVVLTYTSVLQVQYSDVLYFTASLLDELTNTPLPGKSITFTLGTQSVSTVTDVDGTATANLIIHQGPGHHTLVSDFGGDEIYLSQTDNDAFEIKQEDARITYTGALFASTTGASSSLAKVTLSATIQDITAVTGDPDFDPNAGDIINASVTFLIVETGQVISAPIGYVVSGDHKTGVAATTWNADIGSKESDQFTIRIQAGNYYIRDAAEDNTIVTVSRPLNDFVTGGGYLVLSNSSGEKAGDVGRKNNFGFNIKYNKKGTNLQGNINTIIRRTESDGVVHVYQIKGNMMSSLSVQPTSSTTGAAIFNGKANIQDITDPLFPISVDGNAALQVELTDLGEGGIRDEIALTVWNKSGGLWFSSNWTGSKSFKQILGGGNIVVRGGATATVANATQSTDGSVSQLSAEPMSLLESYPNPFNIRTDIRFSMLHPVSYSLEIYDMRGINIKTLRQGVAEPGRIYEAEFDASEYPSGVYLAKLRSDTGMRYIKLIVR